MRLMHLFLSLALLAVLPLAVYALPPPAPPYSVSPTFNGLNVTYFVKRDVFKITLYAVNHEKFPIICDARYDSGSDKQNAHEETLNPEKGAAFSFSYGRRGDDVVLRLICVKPGSPEHLHSKD